MPKEEGGEIDDHPQDVVQESAEGPLLLLVVLLVLVEVAVQGLGLGLGVIVVNLDPPHGKEVGCCIPVYL
jgi:hypothetical protein